MELSGDSNRYLRWIKVSVIRRGVRVGGQARGKWLISPNAEKIISSTYQAETSGFLIHRLPRVTSSPVFADEHLTRALIKITPG